MSGIRITCDKVFNTVQVTHSLIIPSVKSDSIDNLRLPERSLLFDVDKSLLVIKTRNGWRYYSPLSNPTAPLYEDSSTLKANINKDCLELNIIGIIDEDLLLYKIQEYLDEFKGKIKRIQIKDAKDKLSKDFQKLLEKLVKRSKVSNNGLTELDL